ncbi:MAG: GDP-mannose 4,6-dehydratase, partial [Planctomycetota bacterium]
MPDDALTILITGGAGFIGSNFIRFLREHRPQCRIINYDALTYAGNPANLGDLRRDLHYTFIHADVRDRGAMTTALAGCDAVVHFAAESHVDRSINDSGPFLSTNVLGTQVL